VVQWFSLTDLIQKTEGFIDSLQIMRQTKPELVEKNYSFPTEVKQVNSIELGSLQLKLTAFATYVIEELGREEFELNAFETAYSITLNSSMLDYKKTLLDTKGSIPKEMIEGATIKDNDNLKAMALNLIYRKARVTRLETQLKIYEKQINTLSREQSRRDAEIRLVR